MANVYGADAPQAGAAAGFSHAYGNAFKKAYVAEKVAQIADIIYLGRIPAGTYVTDFILQRATGAASATGKVGYTPVSPGTSPTAVDDYWFAAGTNLTTAASTLSTAVPIKFTYDVDIILTVAGAATNGSKISAIVGGEIIGVK